MNHSCVVTPTATIPVPASLQGESVGICWFLNEWGTLKSARERFLWQTPCFSHGIASLAHRLRQWKWKKTILSLPQSDVGLEQLFQKSLYKIEVSSNIKRFNITVILFYKNTDFFFSVDIQAERRKQITTVNILEYILPTFWSKELIT